LYWAGFESIKKYLRESQNMQAGLSTTFISGALSGTVSSLLTAPFDVLKTRRQVFTAPEAAIGAANAIPKATWPLLMHIVRNEGWKALFAGVVPRTAKVAPACGLMIGCYEGVGRYLGGEQGSRL
jgi:solute carrier family 25, member 39/40